MTTRGREVQPPQFQMVIDSTSGATGMSTGRSVSPAVLGNSAHRQNKS